MQRKELSFKGQKVFIGIDVHKKSWTVTVLLEIGAPKTFTQAPSAQTLLNFLKKHYPDGEYHVVYETGFTGYSTYYALKEVGIDCIIVNAADVPSTQYENIMKSDPIDSVKLAKALRANLLKGIYVPSVDNLDDRAVLRFRKTVQLDIAKYKVRIKHTLHCNGICIPERFQRSSHLSSAYLQWLREEVILLSSSRSSLDLLINQAVISRQGLLAANREIYRLIRSPRYKEKADRLCSIPGIGPVCAMTLLTEIVDFSRFHNERQFASYLGLIPTCHSSGEHKSMGEMTSRGNKKLGPVLIEASWKAIVADDGLAISYSNYKRRGLKPQEAIVRIARKLSNIILSVMKNEAQYTTSYAYLA